MVSAGIVAGGSIIGSLIAANAAKGGAAQGSAAMTAQAYHAALQLGIPPDTAKALIYQEYKKLGNYTPQLEQDINAGISQVEQIKENPQLMQQQHEALNILAQRGKGGMTPEDRAAMNQMRDEVARDTEAKRQQIIQNYQQRGMGGAGAEIASQLMAAQGGSNQASAGGDRLAALSSQNALQAMTQGGQLAGQMRQQDFSVNNTKASAADEMKRFDVQNQIARQQRNVGSQNQANQFNMTENQKYADLNTQQANQEQLRQRDAQERYWQNLKDRQALVANAANASASNLTARAGQEAQSAANMSSGIIQGATAIGSALAKKNPAAPTTNTTGAIEDGTMYNRSGNSYAE